MTDIAKCNNESCPLHNQCWRYTSPASERQTYADFRPTVTDKSIECEYFLDNNLR